MSAAEAAQRLLDRHVAAAQPLEARQDGALWDMALSGGAGARALEEATRARAHLYGDAPTFAALGALLKGPPLPPALSRQLAILHPLFEAHQQPPAHLDALVDLETRVEALHAAPLPGDAGAPRTRAALYDALAEETRPAARRRLWDEIRAIGAEAGPLILELARLRNAGARRLGARDHFALSLRHQAVDEGALFGLLGALEAGTRDPFARLKARIDGEIRARFGLPAGAPIPPWLYDDPDFQSRPWDPRDDLLGACLRGRGPRALARASLQAIGLDPAPILARSALGPGGRGLIFSQRVNREGETRVAMPLGRGEGWTRTLLHELGHALYEAHISPDLPWLLRDVSGDAMTEGVAIFLERMVRRPAFFARYAGLSGRRLGKARRALPRMLGEEGLIFTRWALVVVHFERALYRDPEQDLGALWGDLVARFQGIPLPGGEARAWDWAALLHLAVAPVYYQSYLLGGCIASQLEAHLREEVLRGRGDVEDALVSDPAVGAYLRGRIFAPGASLPWDAHLEIATGRPLSAEPFLRMLGGD